MHRLVRQHATRAGPAPGASSYALYQPMGEDEAIRVAMAASLADARSPGVALRLGEPAPDPAPPPPACAPHDKGKQHTPLFTVADWERQHLRVRPSAPVASATPGQGVPPAAHAPAAAPTPHQLPSPVHAGRSGSRSPPSDHHGAGGLSYAAAAAVPRTRVAPSGLAHLPYHFPDPQFRPRSVSPPVEGGVGRQGGVASPNQVQVARGRHSVHQGFVWAG